MTETKNVHIVHNHASTFWMFFLLLYFQHGITNYNYICPILKHHFQKLIQKHICTLRNVKNENIWECWNHQHHIFKTCKALQNHVKAMHAGHLQQYFKYFLLNLSNLRQLLSVTHLIIFALGGNAQNRIKCKKYIYYAAVLCSDFF